MNERTTGAAPAVTTIVDLVFEADCPHVEDARALLKRAMLDAGLPVSWREWDRDDDETPPSLRGLGSPTILVNGSDVSEPDPEADAVRGIGCRIYWDGSELRGVPPLDAITRALLASVRS